MSKKKIEISYKPNIGPTGHLIWVDDFVRISNNEFRAPFVIKDDHSYYYDLREKYKNFFEKAKEAKADLESLTIIKKYTEKILEAIRIYYKGRISSSQNMIENLVKGCMNNSLAVENVYNSFAFPGVHLINPQFFHARPGTPRSFKAKDMLHVPYSMRSKTGNYRFSILGVPSYYLGNSSYCCWLETGMPPEHEFNVSPVLLDGTQKIFNLAVALGNYSHIDEFDPDKVHTWLKLLILMIASSYRVEEEGRSFRSEYIIPQSIMLACKEQKLDGVAYYSCRVESQDFAQSAINLALFTTQERFDNDYSDMCEHLKVGDAFNYFMFQQLGASERNTDKVELRWIKTGLINNIGSYNQQFPYAFTNFCEFDKFLFANWSYESIEYGSTIKEIREEEKKKKAKKGRF